MPTRLLMTLLAAALLGGCGGGYILVAPDVAAMPGGTAPVVVRLQRREFWFHAPSQAGAAIIFHLAGEAQRCGRTDDAGYASIAIRVPAKPGRYRVLIDHQDSLGDTVSGQAEVFVLSADKPILAVDLDALPRSGGHVHAAVAALKRLQLQAQILYTTERKAAKPAEAHDFLKGAGYPAGPVLPWRKPRFWRVGRWWKRSDRPGAMEALRERLPGLLWGITSSAPAGKAFLRAGLKPLIVGRSGPRFGRFDRVTSAEYFRYWPDVVLPPVGPGGSVPASPPAAGAVTPPPATRAAGG